MTTSTVAAPIVGGHHYSLYFVVAAFICLAVALCPIVIRRGETFERRCYWGGTFGAAISVLIAGLPDWLGSLLFACVTVFGMWLPAYFTKGALIKIRGKVYNFHIQRSVKRTSTSSAPSDNDLADEYPDAYNGDTSAAKMWWLMVVAEAILVFGVIVGTQEPDQLWLRVLGILLFVVFAIGFGYSGDGSYGYPIARRQYVQFVLISLISAGAFAFLYLPAYSPWNARRDRSTGRNEQQLPLLAKAAEHPNFSKVL